MYSRDFSAQIHSCGTRCDSPVFSAVVTDIWIHPFHVYHHYVNLLTGYSHNWDSRISEGAFAVYAHGCNPSGNHSSKMMLAFWVSRRRPRASIGSPEAMLTIYRRETINFGFGGATRSWWAQGVVASLLKVTDAIMLEATSSLPNIIGQSQCAVTSWVKLARSENVPR